ncbi:hypothetical protein BU16DRAFT_543568 [Lophium mytilinum]|uniref:Uncharacterized protein n=1 Tax=Lophium mytilinum TaxID=390894 RepID=A0A6A6QDN5_9PEZI|nr:hypothetical protein BU16DRAFT_543568 [Lophium mytilinum]
MEVHRVWDARRHIAFQRPHSRSGRSVSLGAVSEVVPSLFVLTHARVLKRPTSWPHHLRDHQQPLIGPQQPRPTPPSDRGTHIQMPPPTLTTLPAEIRQQIVAETITINVGGAQASSNGPHPFSLSTPLNGLCKILQADVEQIHRGWLPGPKSILRISSPAAVRHLNRVQRYYRNLAESTRREWSSFEEIQVQLFSSEEPRWTLATLEDQLPRLTVESLVRKMLVTSVSTWDTGALRIVQDWSNTFQNIPDTIKRVAIDLTVPPALLKYLEERDTMFQQSFWKAAVLHMQAHLERLMPIVWVFCPGMSSRRIMGFAYELVGRLPESQVDAVVGLSYQPEYGDWWQFASSMHLKGFMANARPSDHPRPTRDWRGQRQQTAYGSEMRIALREVNDGRDLAKVVASTDGSFDHPLTFH